MIDWETAAPSVFIAFGVGCASGYGFAMRTAIATLRGNVQELRQRIKELEDKYEKRTDQLIKASSHSSSSP